MNVKELYDSRSLIMSETVGPGALRPYCLVCACSSCAYRCMMNCEASMKRSTQLVMHVSCLPLSFESTEPMHFSQQVSFILKI